MAEAKTAPAPVRTAERAPNSSEVKAVPKHTKQEIASTLTHRSPNRPQGHKQLRAFRADTKALTRLRERNADLLGTQTKPDTTGKPLRERPPVPRERPRLTDLRTKLDRADAKNYTPQEKDYLQYGWKTYLRKNGEQAGYSLEDIARTEKLAASDIQNAIAEGIVKDPAALRLYGRLRLEQAKASLDKTLTTHPDRNEAWFKERVATLRQLAADECTPLIQGDRAALTGYSLRQAQAARELAESNQLNITDDERVYYRATVPNWLNLANSTLTEQANQPNQETAQLPGERTPPQLTDMLAYFRKQPQQIDLRPEAIQPLIESLQEEQQRAPQEQKQEANLLLELLLSLLPIATQVAAETTKETIKEAKKAASEQP